MKNFNNILNSPKEFEIMSKMIYDFKLPIDAQINAISTFLSITKTKITAEEKEFLELTLNSCKTMKNLIEIFLLHKKLKEKRVSLNCEKFDFIIFLYEIIENFKILLQHYNLKLILNLPKNLIIYADKDFLKKTIENLTINLINYSHKNTEFIIEVIEKKTELDFLIKTTGKYIEPIFKNEIFCEEKRYTSWFSQVAISLGMNTLAEIVYLHFGKMIVKSYQNNENVFGFTLPK